MVFRAKFTRLENHPHITWIKIRGADRDHGCCNGHIFKYLVGVWHGIKQGGVIIKIQYVAVHGESTGEGWVASILSLNHQNVMLNLEKDIKMISCGI